MEDDTRLKFDVITAEKAARIGQMVERLQNVDAGLDQILSSFLPYEDKERILSHVRQGDYELLDKVCRQLKQLIKISIKNQDQSRK